MLILQRDTQYTFEVFIIYTYFGKLCMIYFANTVIVLLFKYFSLFFFFFQCEYINICLILTVIIIAYIKQTTYIYFHHLVSIQIIAIQKYNNNLLANQIQFTINCSISTRDAWEKMFDNPKNNQHLLAHISQFWLKICGCFVDLRGSKAPQTK